MQFASLDFDPILNPGDFKFALTDQIHFPPAKCNNLECGIDVCFIHNIELENNNSIGIIRVVLI